MKGWEAETRLKDGQVNIEFADGTRLTVKNDGVTGYSFLTEYLAKMRQHYSNHLIAIDQILQQELGDDYKHIKSIPKVYESYLAVQSMNCVFGRYDGQPDCDENGELHLEFTVCPRRAICRYNGFNERYKNSKIVGCNPIYECGLTPQRAKIANMLVNTSLDYTLIAEMIGISRRTVETIGKEVFETLGVHSRPELTQKLKGKRLL